MDNTVGLAQNPSPPEPAVVAYCAYCEGGGEIYQGQYFGDNGITCVHYDCADKLKDTLSEQDKRYINWDKFTKTQKLNFCGFNVRTRM